MTTSNEKKPPEREVAQEMFYWKNGLRADAALHESILDGDHSAAEAIGRKVAKRLGLTDQQIDRLHKSKK